MSLSGAMSGLTLGLLGLAAAACGGRELGEEGSDRDRGRPPPRRFADVAWREVFRVGGSLEDTLLLSPGRLAADRGGVVVVDIHGGRALRFGPRGELRWSWGRKGRGPGELAHPRDVKLDARGRVWILDVENGRIVVLSADGQAARRIPLDRLGARADDLVPLDDGGAVLLLADPERPIARLDSVGRVLARGPLPWTGRAELDPLAAQLIVGADPASGRWAAAFQLGDGFFVFRGDRWLGYRGRFVEPVPFARSVRHRSGRRFGRSETVTTLASPTFAAWSVALADGRLFVLFIGRTEAAGRILDVYGLDDGAYRETLPLPQRVNQVAWGGGTLYATYDDPFPTLIAWRPERRPRPGGRDARHPDAGP